MHENDGTCVSSLTS